MRGADAPVGEFRPTSPADSYYEDVARSTGDEATVDPSLDAEEIAAALLGAGQIVVAAETVEDDPKLRTSALPSWATVEPTTPPVPPVSTREPRGEPRTTFEPPEAGDEVFEGDRWSTASTEWEQREAARLARRKARPDLPIPRVRTLISLAVFGFFAIGFIVSLVDGREPIADAVVGDCFIVGDAIEIEEVAVVDCAQTHDSELFARVDMVSAFGTTFPGEEPAFDWLFEECLERFPGYTGEAYEESRYWIDMFIPTTESWSDGDHIGMCTLVVVDDDLNIVTSTGSGRAPGANA